MGSQNCRACDADGDPVADTVKLPTNAPQAPTAEEAQERVDRIKEQKRLELEADRQRIETLKKREEQLRKKKEEEDQKREQLLEEQRLRDEQEEIQRLENERLEREKKQRLIEEQRVLKEKAEQEKEAMKLAALEQQKTLRLQKFLGENGFAGVNDKKKGGGMMAKAVYPLHKAVELNDPELVSILLERKADKALRSSAGKTALEKATKLNKSNSHSNVIAILRA